MLIFHINVSHVKLLVVLKAVCEIIRFYFQGMLILCDATSVLCISISVIVLLYFTAHLNSSLDLSMCVCIQNSVQNQSI